MTELLATIDAWLATEEGVFWATIAGFIALAAIPASILIWAFAVSREDAIRWKRLKRKVQVARELQPK